MLYNQTTNNYNYKTHSLIIGKIKLLRFIREFCEIVLRILSHSQSEQAQCRTWKGGRR